MPPAREIPGSESGDSDNASIFLVCGQEEIDFIYLYSQCLLMARTVLQGSLFLLNSAQAVYRHSSWGPRYLYAREEHPTFLFSHIQTVTTITGISHSFQKYET